MIISLLHTLVRGRYALAGIHSRRLVTKKVHLHYYDSLDSKPTVLFLHGLGTSASSWTHVLPKLTDRFRVIAPDLPGFGFSFLPPNESFATFKDHIDTLQTLLREQVSGPFILVGHSLGGWLAILLAIHQPEAVRRLILVNPAGVMYEGIAELRSSFELSSVSDTAALLDRMWYSYPVIFRPFTAAIFRELSRRHVGAFVQSIRENDVVNPHLHKLTMKVDLIAGREDRLIPAETIDFLRRHIPNASCHYIDRCGHVPQLERPGQFFRVLERVLQESSDRQVHTSGQGS